MNKSKLITIVAIAAIVTLLITNVATVYLLLSKSKIAKKPVVENVIIAPVPATPFEDEVSVEESEKEDGGVVDESSPDDLAILAEATRANQIAIYATSGPKFVIPAGMKRVKIDWADGGKVEARDFFSVKYGTIASLSASDYEKLFTIGGYIQDTDTYKIGYDWEIKKVGIVASSSDKYAGLKIYDIRSWRFDCEGPGCNTYLFNGLVVADEESDTLLSLSRYSSNQDTVKSEFGSALFKDDNSAYIPELENPNSINLPGTTYKLHQTSNNFSAYLSNVVVSASDVYVADANNGKRVYLSSYGCFIIYNENGGNSSYELDYPISLSGVLDITFNDGSKNKNDYIGRTIGGCGSYGCGNLVKTDLTGLEVVGKFVNGDAVYAHVLTETDFPPEGQTKEEYIASYPQIFWKSPIKDYYLSFTNMKYMQAVECGKPVIYLYPEKETDVKVQVTPNGGFSITDPIYGDDGWLVRADTQSNLYNYADGKNYPYLFWEGKAVYYERPTKGFVVARENVNSFLDEKLAKLGMIGKEITDFKEFWAPKMTEKPYYFVTFLPKNEFDLLAPMKVEPKPQTIIRVFMDYQGLDNPITVEEPVIKTPIRKGFTVVEWGGALGRN